MRAPPSCLVLIFRVRLPPPWSFLPARTCTRTAQGRSHLHPVFPGSLCPCGCNFPKTSALINKGRRRARNWKHSWDYQRLLLRTAPFTPLLLQFSSAPRRIAPRHLQTFRHLLQMKQYFWKWHFCGTQLIQMSTCLDNGSLLRRSALKRAKWLSFIHWGVHLWFRLFGFIGSP